MKKKLSEVLAALKTQLEQKYNKKMEEVLNQNDITATEHVINDTSSIRVSSTNLIPQWFIPCQEWDHFQCLLARSLLRHPLHNVEYMTGLTSL